MKQMQKMLAVFSYLLIISIVFDFQLKYLFDIKQIILVILGGMILYLPSHKKELNKKSLKIFFGRNTLMAGYIQTFVLLFILLMNVKPDSDFFYNIALNCRPTLYGFCIWLILNEETVIIQNEKVERISTASEGYYRLLEIGLTKREAEVAIQVCQGKRNAEIAAELHISETTVKKHMSNIFEKLEITKREQIREKL